MKSLFLKISYFPILILLLLGWYETIQCTCDEMKWDEWHRHCDIALGYCLSVTWTQALHCGSVTVNLKTRQLLCDWWVSNVFGVDTLDKGMIHSHLDKVEWDSVRFLITLTRMVCSLKFMNCLFSNFLFNIFRLQLTVGNWNHG